MASDSTANDNVPRCEKCDDVPRCKKCGSVRLFVHPTRAITAFTKTHIESRVTCADCGTFVVLNKLP